MSLLAFACCIVDLGLFQQHNRQGYGYEQNLQDETMIICHNWIRCSSTRLLILFTLLHTYINWTIGIRSALDLGGNGGFAVHDPVFGQGTFALSRPSGFGGNQPSLEEIEAQLSRTAGAQPHMQMQQERKMMSLEEVEAALMNINGGRPIYSEAMIAEQQAKQARLEQRRAERQAKQAEVVSHLGRIMIKIDCST